MDRGGVNGVFHVEEHYTVKVGGGYGRVKL